MKKKFKLNKTEQGQVQYLADKMNEGKHVALYLDIAKQIGVGQLERAIGLTLEASDIRSPGAYMVKICKVAGYNPGKSKQKNGGGC